MLERYFVKIEVHIKIKKDFSKIILARCEEVGGLARSHYFSTAKNFSNDGLTERAKIASQKIEKKPFVPNRRKGNEIIATTG